VVEQVARPLREEAVAQLLVLGGAREQARDREQLDVRQRDEVVGTDEDVELGGVQPADPLVVDREVEDDEAVVRVLVDLRPLPAGEHVFDVEGVPAEPLGQRRHLGLRRPLEMDPGEAVRAELRKLAWRRGDPGRFCDRPAPLYPRQARHRY
jgi:hypothetical protein